jgi:Holliday junction resolvase
MTGDLTIRERDLQKQVRAMLDAFGWRTAVTWTSIHSPRGFPDLFAVRGPEAVAIELKAEKGKVSEYQTAWLDALAQVPGVKFAQVVRPSSWYAGVLDEVLR